jgi:hypothetical protein
MVQTAGADKIFQALLNQSPYSPFAASLHSQPGFWVYTATLAKSERQFYSKARSKFIRSLSNQ